MSKTWLDEVEARLVGLGLPWTAEKDGSSHRGAVRDAGGEVVAVTYCTAYDDVHGAGMATVIAAMPADLRRLLRVARAAEAALPLLDCEGDCRPGIREHVGRCGELVAALRGEEST